VDLEAYLGELQRRVERHIGSRSADVSAAARRAKALLLTVRRHTAADVPASLATEAAFEASALLAGLEARQGFEGARRRAEQLARVRPIARRKYSDEDLIAAIERGGSCRQIARRLGCNPSTVVRRRAALHPVTGCNGDARA